MKLFDNIEIDPGIINVEKEEDDGCRAVYRIDYQGGCGHMTVFSVIPGAKIIFDDFDVTDCYCGIQQSKNVMQINYCMEGRSECELQNGYYRYLGNGDISISNLSNHAVRLCFPLGYYKGIDITVYIDEFSNSISRFFPGISIDVSNIRSKLCAGNKCFVMRAKDTIEHIFSDLYNIPPSIRAAFFRFRILELLMYLDTIDVSKCNEKREYYPKQLAEKVKKIKARITVELENRHTVESLADEYGISRTALKSCFKGIYGIPIGEFMKDYRMQAAAELLKETNRSVLSISEHVGYKNQSRFAAAFKCVMGKSPLQYRKDAG